MMSFTFLVYTVPVFLQAVAAIAFAVIACYRYRHAPAKAYAALMLVVAIWSLANVFEKVSGSFDLKVAWANMQYVGGAFAPVAWLALGMTFTGRGKWLNRWTLLALSIVPLFVITTVWTDEWHGLARRSVELAQASGFGVLRVTYGPVLKLHVLYSYLLMFSGSLLMFEAMLMGDRNYRIQAGVMFTSAVIPWMFNVLYLLEVPYFDRFDPTPLAFCLPVLAVGWCIHQSHLLDLIPVARDAVVEAIVDGVVVLDTQNRILDINPAARRALHAESGSLVGTKIDDVLVEQAEVLAELARDPLLRQEVTIDDQSGPRTYEISLSPIFDSGRRLMGRVAIFRDITERKIAEASDQASQARYRSVLEEASDGIFVFDSDHILRATNPRGLEMFGYSEAEVLGRSMLDFSPPEDVQSAPFDLRPLINGKRLLRERRFRHKSGHWIPVEVSATQMADGYFQAIVRDITERKRAEEEQKRLESQIQHAQKLESLGVLAGGIAHDFNNLLVGMLANAGLALLDLPKDSPAQRSIEQLETAARRASELCRQMLAYSGRGTFEVQPIDMVALSREMVSFLSASLSKKVVLTCDFPEEACGMEGDAAQIQQLVMNLITNGAEAIGTGSGSVNVRIKPMHADEHFLTDTFGSSGLAEGKYILFEVTDDGCGMAPETKAKIFDPFFSTKFAGRGLGLAAVLGIVRRHRGAIHVTSEPDQGTTVSVLLPAAEVVPVPVPKPVRSLAERVGSGTILVVDDEDSVRVVAKRILKRFGYEVLLARDGREAVSTFAEHQSEIDLVLLDLTMPEMNGEETFSEIRQISPAVKVILSSGYNETEVTDHFNGQAPADFLQKPYGPMDLIDKVRSVLGASLEQTADQTA